VTLIAGLLAALALLTGGGGTAAVAPRTHARSVGVTVDDVAHLSRTMASLRHLPGVPWVREVLDVDHARPARVGGYQRSTRRLATVSHVMAEIADSSELRKVSVRQLARRTTSYLHSLGDSVGLWEVGNEVNGSWTGPRAAVASKVRTVFHRVRAAGGRTALTLYENQGCRDGHRELTPTAWSRRYLPVGVRDHLDEVLLSYYEPQCHGRRPSAAAWTRRMRALHRLFPHALVGFGEVGLPRPATKRSVGAARSVIRYYYGLRLALPYFVGGDFYWYYAEDMTPWRRSPLWRVLRRTVTGR
jgi:hypothetical protein